jgi:hypothetical protein
LKLPKTGSPQQGSTLSSANAKANQVRYGDPVRELFGEDEIFPDYSRAASILQRPTG